VEGSNHGDDSGRSPADISEAATNTSGPVGPVDGSGNAAERSDPGHGTESDSVRTGDAGDIFSPSSENQGLTQPEIIREVSREVSHEVTEMLVSSGPVPAAGDLYAYTPEHQDRIIRMAEAPRTDESRRRSILTDAQAIVVKRAQLIQAGLFVTCIASTAVSLWVFSEPLGVIFLSVPVMQGIGSVVRSVREKD
jgi:hypothetical protein